MLMIFCSWVFWDYGGCGRFNRFMLVGVFFGGFRSPQAPGARCDRERQILFRRYAGGGGEDASKCFCQSPRFSAERLAKNFAAACRIGARQLRRASAIFFPHTPIFPAGDTHVGVRCCVLWLFYSSLANG